MNTSEGAGMTLAVTLSALRRLREPGTAFADARRFSEYVGVISEGPIHELRRYTRKRRIREDFFTGPGGPEETLASVGRNFESERHVLIGTEPTHREWAEATGWEYLTIEAAAEAAEWDLGTPRRPDGEPKREDWP